MKQKQISLVMFAASFIGCLAFIGHAVALDTTFHQSIRPINCTISSVQAGSAATTDYSAACGPVVVPGKSYSTRFRSTVSFPSSGGMPSSSAPQREAGRGLVYLNDIEGIYRPGGVTLLLKKDLVYTFRVGRDNALFAPRTLEVFQMTSSSLDLQLSSYEGVIHLAVGKIQKIDVSKDGAADTMFRLEGFQSSDTALVRVGLLTRPNGVIQTNKFGFCTVSYGGYARCCADKPLSSPPLAAAWETLARTAHMPSTVDYHNNIVDISITV